MRGSLGRWREWGGPTLAVVQRTERYDGLGEQSMQLELRPLGIRFARSSSDLSFRSSMVVRSITSRLATAKPLRSFTV